MHFFAIDNCGRLRARHAEWRRLRSYGPRQGSEARYTREGARVVCFDLDAALAEETAAIIRDESGEAMAISGNAASSKDVKAAVDLAIGRFGALNFLLNNVGIVIDGVVVGLSEEN